MCCKADFSANATAIGKRAKAADKAIGILTVDGKAEPSLAQGATRVGVGSDKHLLIAAADALAARFARKAQ